MVKNSGHLWDNSWYSSNLHGKTYGLEVDAWTAVEPVPYLCAVSLNSSCEEFSKPSRVMSGTHTHTKTSQSGSPGDFVHVNKFSILASDDDEKFLGGCDVAKQVTKIRSRTGNSVVVTNEGEWIQLLR